MKTKWERILVSIGALLIIALAVGLPFILNKNADLQIQFASSQLSFSAVAFFTVFLTLYFSIIQLRKTMAKPKLEVIFIDTGKHETIVDVSKKDNTEHKLELAVLNKGNAITSCFQVDLKIPIIFSPTIATSSVYLNHRTAPIIPKPEISSDYRVISFMSNDNDHCFVNLPLPIYTISIRTSEEKCSDYNNFNIEYKIYGDWAESQEGTLKVKINRL